MNRASLAVYRRVGTLQRPFVAGAVAGYAPNAAGFLAASARPVHPSDRRRKILTGEWESGTRYFNSDAEFLRGVSRVGFAIVSEKFVPPLSRRRRLAAATNRLFSSTHDPPLLFVDLIGDRGDINNYDQSR